MLLPKVQGPGVRGGAVMMDDLPLGVSGTSRPPRILLAVADWSHPSPSPTAKWAVDLRRHGEPFHSPPLRATSDPQLHMFCLYGRRRRQKTRGSWGLLFWFTGTLVHKLVLAGLDHGHSTLLVLGPSFLIVLIENHYKLVNLKKTLNFNVSTSQECFKVFLNSQSWRHNVKETSETWYPLKGQSFLKKIKGIQTQWQK